MFQLSGSSQTPVAAATTASSSPPEASGTPKAAAAAAKPTSKIWKSKLKEHYDKTHKGKNVEIRYASKESPRGGWMSTVYCPDIGYAEGEGASKGTAEHNAAYNALKKLGVSVTADSKQ